MTAPVPLADRGIPAGEHRGLYLAGPMSGYQNHNYPAFAAAAKVLRDKGHDVVSPAELHDDDLTRPFDWYLRRDLTALLTCSAIVLLPNWIKSRGARVEYDTAYALGMDRYSYRNGNLYGTNGAIA